MTIPTTGTFSDATCRSEWSLGLPMSSDQLRAAAGLGLPFTSNDLRGRSVFDPVPDDYPAIYLFGSDYFNASVGASEQWTFTGINTAVTLRFNVSGACGSSFNATPSGSVAVGIVSGSGSGGSQNWSRQTATKSFTIVVNNNTKVQIYAGVSASGYGFGQNASADFNGDFTIDNLTSGQNGVASGSFSLTCSNSGMIDPSV